MLMYHFISSLLVAHGPLDPRTNQSGVVSAVIGHLSSIHPYLPCDLVGFPFVILEGYNTPS